MKTLTETLTNYIAACFSGLWIETFEPDEAVREIETLCREQSWNMTVWDISQGDPLTAITAAASLGNGETPQLFLLRNFHRFLGSVEIVQAMERQIQQGKVSRTFLIVLAPVVQIPVELEKAFVVVEHPLTVRKSKSPKPPCFAGFPRHFPPLRVPGNGEGRFGVHARKCHVPD